MLIFSDCVHVRNEFLPHGIAAGDAVHSVTEGDWSITFSTIPYRVFGSVKDGIILNRGTWVSIKTNNVDTT